MKKHLRSIKFVIFVAILLLMVELVYFTVNEMRTSRLQARYLARLGHELTFRTEPGPSPSTRYPSTGPYDHRLGYADLPTYLQRLSTREYTVVEQARLSPRMKDMIDRGLYVPYAEKDQAGFSVLDCNGVPIYATRYPERVYPAFEAVPSLLANSLLYIENRTLLDPSQPRRNPA